MAGAGRRVLSLRGRFLCADCGTQGGLFPLFLHSFPAPRWMSLSASTASSCSPRGTAPRRPRRPRTGGQDGSVPHLEVPRHIQRKRTSVSESAYLRGALELQTIEPWGSRKVGLMAPVSPHPFHRDHIQTLGEEASRKEARGPWLRCLVLQATPFRPSASDEVREFLSEMSFVKYSGSERRPHANSKEHEYLQINSLPLLSFS